MKKLILHLIVALLSISANAQIKFQKAYGGIAIDEGTSVRQTTDGGYIIAGTTASYGSGGFDILVIKTNSVGDTMWSKTFGGAIDNEYGFCVQQTTDGGYVVSGVTSSFADIAGDMYLIKIQANGDTAWTRTYGGNGYEWGAYVQQTSDGGYILVGQTPAFGAGWFDAYLVKVNAIGSILWTKTFGGIGSEYGTAVQQTVDGGYILTGSNDNTFGFGASDFYLIKTDSTGNISWSKTYGNSGFEEGNAVKQTSDGGYIIAGSSENTIGPLGPNMCLIKTNSLGDTLWAKLYGGNMIDECYDVVQTNDGGYIMVGKSFSFSALGDYDVYVVKVNGQGNVQWSKTYGGSTVNHNEIGYSIGKTNDGGYIIVGESLYGFGVGLKNIYLIKTDSLGNSGCNEGNPATAITNYLPQVASTPTTLTGSGGFMNMPATIVNTGTTQTNLCMLLSNSIPELKSINSISIFPNPFDQELNIEVIESVKLEKITVYNVMGQKLFNKSLIDNSTNSILLDLKELKSGVYFCFVFSTNESKIFKIVKK